MKKQYENFKAAYPSQLPSLLSLQLECSFLNSICANRANHDIFSISDTILRTEICLRLLNEYYPIEGEILIDQCKLLYKELNAHYNVLSVFSENDFLGK